MKQEVGNVAWHHRRFLIFLYQKDISKTPFLTRVANQLQKNPCSEPENHTMIGYIASYIYDGKLTNQCLLYP